MEARNHLFACATAALLAANTIPAANAADGEQLFPPDSNYFTFPRLYSGASIGGSFAEDLPADAEFEGGFSDVDDDDLGWKVYVGGHLNPFLGAEIGYVDLGEFTQRITSPGRTERIEAEVEGINLVGIGSLPVFEDRYNHVSLFAKAGVFWWSVDSQDRITTGSSTVSFSADDEDYDPTVGAGVLYRFGPYFALRAEWERFFDIGSGNTTDIDLFSVGLQIEGFPLLR